MGATYRVVMGIEIGRVDRPRVRAWLVAAAVVVAGVYPMAWPQGRDSFPLSSYPMFATVRDDVDVELVIALGTGAEGARPLPTEATGHRHLTQAVRALSGAVRRGGDHPQRICEEAAAWAEEHEPDVGQVSIVTASFDALDFLRDGERQPTTVLEHSTCAVGP